MKLISHQGIMRLNLHRCTQNFHLRFSLRGMTMTPNQLYTQFALIMLVLDRLQSDKYQRIKIMDSSDESMRGDSDSSLTSTLVMESDNSLYLRWSASESDDSTDSNGTESVDGSELDNVDGQQEVQIANGHINIANGNEKLAVYSLVNAI